jgi:ATP-dependent Lon protease
MYIIHTKGYVVNEKLVIAQRYVIPKICDQVKFTEKDIVISDEMVRYILENEQFCKKEGGVRNLKRCLEIIYTKLNLFRIMKPDSPFFKIHKGIPQNITFPYNVIKSDLDLLLKNDNELTIPSYKYFYV